MIGSLSVKSLAERRQVAIGVVEPRLKGIRDRKVAGTYGRVAPGEDGRIRTILSPNTASFRFSSGESLLFPASTNLQNLEKKVARLDPLYQVRDVIIPDEGKVLVAGDFKGAEAILCGAYSEDWDLVEKILRGDDVHQELADFMFETVTATKLQRDIGKTIRYASQYAAKVPTITQNLNKEAETTGRYYSIDEVTIYHRKLLLKHPLERWWETTRRTLEKQHNVMYNCFGYRRTFHHPDEHSRLKEALSFLPQSTVGYLMNLALPQAFATLDGDTHQLLLQVHDELLWQTYPDAVSDLLRALVPLFQRPFKIHGRELYIPVEFKTGPNWGQMKDVKLITA